MKLLVYGGAGWLGSYVCSWLQLRGDWQIHASSVRVKPGCEGALKMELDTVRPDAALTFIGRARGDGIKTIDYLEDPKRLKDNINDNLLSAVILARAAEDAGIKLTYFGTGCIFENLSPEYKGRVFTTDDNANFFGSSYSTVKGATDYLMRKVFADTVLNVRIRMPILDESHKFDFITKIANYEKVIDERNSVTVLPSLMPYLEKAMREGQAGTLNLVNPGPMTHVEMLVLYEEIVDPTHVCTLFTIEEQNEILKSERSNNVLVPSFPDAPDTRTALESALRARQNVV